MKYKKLSSLVLLGLLVNQPIGYAGPVIDPKDPSFDLVTNPSSTSTLITQPGDSLSLNWDSFNVNQNETVEFDQPSVSSIAVNNISSLDPSLINGQISSNGQVVLINPNGLIFGNDAVVNVGGIVASGLNINSEQFLNGTAFLNHKENSKGFVINNGVITASTGGSVTLIGTEVENNNLITASLGKVTLAAGNSAVLTFDTMGMFGVEVTGETIQNIYGNDDSAIRNNGEINSEGGQVLLTAEISRDVFTNAVNNQGIVTANSIEMHDGVIRITSSTGDVQQDGMLDVSASTNDISGGKIEVLAENINNTGVIKADSLNTGGGSIHLESNDTTIVTGDSNLSAQSINQGVGGEINVLGDFVGLGDNTIINASGFNGGGSIHIGGGFQGSDSALKNAQQTYIAKNVNLYADAIETGNGGNIIVWSDSITDFFGNLSAEGGLTAGDGGFAEVSGKQELGFTGSASLASNNGTSGTLLLDPDDIFIVESGSDDVLLDNDGDLGAFGTTFSEGGAGNDRTISSSAIVDILDDGNNVILQASDDIEVNFLIDTNNASTGNLTLQATETIIFNANIDIAGGDLTLISGTASDEYIQLNQNTLLTANIVNFNGKLRSENNEYNNLQITGDASFSDVVGVSTTSSRRLGLLSVSDQATINTTGINTVDSQSYGSIYLGDSLSTTLYSGGQGNSSGISAASISGNASSLSSITLYADPTETNGNININSGAVTSAAIFDINALTITDSNSVTVTGSTNLSSGLTLTDTTGAVTFNGELNAASISTSAQGYSLAFNHGGGLSTTSATTFSNSGALTFGNESTDSFSFNGSITHSTSLTNLFGEITTTNDTITLDNLMLLGNSKISTDTGNGDIIFNGTIEATNDYTDTLLLSAGSRDIEFNGIVGGNNNELGSVTIENTRDIDINEDFTSASLTANTNISGDFDSIGFLIDTSAKASSTSTGNNAGSILISADTISLGGLTANGSQGVGGSTDGGDGGDITLTSANSNPFIDLFGDIYSLEATGSNTNGTGGAITFNDFVYLRSDVTISTGQFGGKIDFKNDIFSWTGSYGLSLTAGTGDIDFDGDIGTVFASAENLDYFIINSAGTTTFNGGLLTKGTSGIDITSNSIDLTNNSIQIESDTTGSAANGSTHTITYNTNSLNFGNSSTDASNSTVTITPIDTSITIGVNDSSNTTYNLTNVDLNKIAASEIIIGSSSHQTHINVAGSGSTNSENINLTSSGISFITGTSFEINLFGDITTDGKVIGFNSHLNLLSSSDNSGILSLSTGASVAGDVNFNKSVSAQTAYTQALNLASGTGNIVFADVLGPAANELANLTISSSNNVDFNKLVMANIVSITNSGILDIAASSSFDLTGSFSQLNSGGTGSVSLGGNITTTAGAISFANSVTLDNNVSLNTGTGLDNITFSGALDAVSNQTLGLTADTGNITFSDTVGAGGNALGNLTINSATNVDFDNTVNAAIVSITNSGLLDISSGASFSLSGAFTQIHNVTTSVSLGDDITTTADNITFNSPLTLDADAVLNTGTGIGNIIFNKTIDAISNQNLVLVADAGNIDFSNTVGAGGNALGGITITSANNADFNFTVNASRIIQTAGTGTTTFSGLLTTTDTLAAGLNLSGNNFTFNGGVATSGQGNVAITNSGLLDINSAFNLSGLFEQTDNGGTVSLGAGITTTVENIIFNSAVTLDANVLLNTGTSIGHINFNNTLAAAANETLGLTAGIGNITFGNTVGAGGNTLGDLTINSATNVDFYNTVNAAIVAITNTGVLDIASGANFSLSGAFTQTHNASTTVSLGAGITTTADNITFNSPVTFDANASLNTGTGMGSITFNNTLDALSNQNLGLATGAGNIDFTNTVGAGGNALGNITISSANDVGFDSTVNASRIFQTAGTGTTAFSGLLTTTDTLAAGLNLSGNNFTFNGGVATSGQGNVAITNSGLLGINSAFNLSGLFEQTDNGGTVSLGAGITTTADNIIFNSAVTLDANVLLDTGTGIGHINFNNTLAAAANETLGLTAGIGNITFGNTVGAGGNTLGAVTVNSANNIDIDADLSAFALTVGNDGYFNADTVTINTSGVAGANGGAINITSVGDITVTNLTTDGGSGTTTAGNITLDGNNIVLNGLQSVMDTQGTPAAIIKLTSANDIDLKAASFSTNLASMSLTGNGAVSMLTGTADDITWTVSSLNTGTLAGITGITPLVSFTNFANLTGYLGIDTFELANAIDITGTINGGGASDVVNLSTAGQTVQIGPSKYLSIESLTIAGSGNTLQGTINVPTTFIISGSGTGSVGLMSFAGFQTINGGDQADTFELNSLNNGMTLNGGLGSDILEADLINNTLTADADGDGNLFDKIDQTVNFTSIGVFANNGIGTFIVTGPDIATLYTIDENGSVSYGSSLFSNVDILNGGALADTFQINGDFGGTVNGMGGADIFQIDTVSLTNATILYGHNNVTTSTANDSIQGIYLTQIGLPVYSWEIDTSSTGKINGALFNDINTLNGSTSVEITDNLSTAIAVNSWAINSSNSTVGTYTFNNMESITGGTGIDTFDVNNVIDGLTISGNGSADILKSDFISNSLAITNATTGNGTLTFTGNTISFNNILAFTNDSIAIGDFILTGPSIGTAYTLDINGSVSLGSLSFNNVDILNAGNNGDSFQIDGDFGVVNGMGGADIFQINTPLLTNTTVLYGHNSSTMSLSDDLIQGLYIGQVGNVTYNWEIDSATTGKINGALFNDINVLSGSTHINITDVLTSNIATNTWAINSISSTVDAYTFNNMEELKGGSGVDIFDINNIIDGLTVDGQAGIDILKADLITNELIITDAITGNGTLTSAGNTISFNNILSFNNDSIAIGDFILTGPSTATSYTLDVNGDVSLGTLLFSNVDVLNAGNSGDSFQIDGDFGGKVNGMGGVDEFQINTDTLSASTILYGHNSTTTSLSDDLIQGVYIGQIGGVTYNWEIDSATAGKINGAIFNDINILAGSISNNITDNLSSNIASNTWAINATNSTVGAYIFNNMEEINGGGGIDTFTVNSIVNGLILNGLAGNDILQANFNTYELTIDNASTGKATLSSTPTSMTFNSVQTYTHSGGSAYSLSGPSDATSYVLDNGGSVSFGFLTFSNVNEITAGDSTDTFQINGDFGGTVNGMGGIDVFQINTDTLSASTILYGHNSTTMSSSDDLIQGVYIGQVGNVAYNWEIDSTSSGKINNALFNDINILSGSADNNITDTLTSNIVGNTWLINPVDSEVAGYTFNNMEIIKGGSGADSFAISSAVVTGDFDSINGGDGNDTFTIAFADHGLNIFGDNGVDTIVLNGNVDSSSATINSNGSVTLNQTLLTDSQSIIASGVEQVNDNTVNSSFYSVVGSSDSDTVNISDDVNNALIIQLSGLSVNLKNSANVVIDLGDGASDTINFNSNIDLNNTLSLTAENITSTGNTSIDVAEIELYGFDSIGSVDDNLTLGLASAAAGDLQLTLNNSGVLTDANVYLELPDSTNIVSADITGNLNMSLNSNLTDSGTVLVSRSTDISGVSTSVILDTANNNFNNISLNNLSNVEIIDFDSINLENVSVNNLALNTGASASASASGSVTNTGEVKVSGVFDVSTNFSDVNLTYTDSDAFTVDINKLSVSNTNNVVIRDSSGIEITGVNNVSNIDLTLSSNLMQSGSIIANSLDVIFIGNGSNNIDLSTSNNNQLVSFSADNANSVSLKVNGGLSVGLINALSDVTLEATGSLNQTDSWFVNGDLSVQVANGTNIDLSNTSNDISGVVTFLTTDNGASFNNVNFYNNADINLGNLIANNIDIQSSGIISNNSNTSLIVSGSANFDTDLNNTGQVHNISLLGNNDFNSLTISDAASVEVNDAGSVTLNNITTSSDFSLSVEDDITNTGNIFIGGNSVLNSVNGGDINIGSVGNINLAGTTLFTTQADSFSSVNLISANNIQLINDSLVSVGSLNINADLVLSNDLLIQSTSANVSHTGSIDGFVNLTVSTNNNIEFSASDIGQVTPLNTVNMTAEVINAGKINALNGITMESTLGNIVFDQLNSQSEINLTSAGSISSNTYINTSGYTDISSDVLITNSIDGVFGLNGDLFTSVNDYSAINTGIGGILISNIGTITLSGIEILDGDILINATGSINQTGDIIIQQGTNNLTLTAGDEITMFEPAKSVISHGNIIYQALNTITISELTITGGDGIENDNILIETDLGDIATTNVGISLNEPDVTANVVSFVAENGSLGVGAQQFVINADKLVTIATVFSNQPFYVVAPENGVIDSSTVVSPTDASSLLGGDQRTQFSDLSAVDPTIFTEVRNFEEDETAILLPEDQLYTSKL